MYSLSLCLPATPCRALSAYLSYLTLLYVVLVITEPSLPVSQMQKEETAEASQ